MLLIDGNSTHRKGSMETIDRRQGIYKWSMMDLAHENVQARLGRDTPGMLMGKLKKKFTTSPRLQPELINPLSLPMMTLKAYISPMTPWSSLLPSLISMCKGS